MPATKPFSFAPSRTDRKANGAGGCLLLSMTSRGVSRRTSGRDRGRLIDAVRNPWGYDATRSASCCPGRAPGGSRISPSHTRKGTGAGSPRTGERPVGFVSSRRCATARAGLHYAMESIKAIVSIAKDLRLEAGEFHGSSLAPRFASLAYLTRLARIFMLYEILASRTSPLMSAGYPDNRSR